MSQEPFFAEIAGTEFFSLLEDLDEIEDAVRGAALYHQFQEHYRDAFELAGHAACYWLEEDGAYADMAAGLIQEMFRLRDVIFDHFSCAEESSLPRVLSRVMGLDEDITNSRIVASYAFVQAIEAVQVLGDWLFELEGAVYDLDADLIEQLRQRDPAQYRLLVERKRRAQSDSEITARESFAQLLGAADKTLMIAALYEQAEIGLASERFEPGSFFPQALKTIFKNKSAEKGRAAGLANRRPDSAKQIEARARRRRICAEADRFLKLEPKIIQSDLVSRLVAKGGLGSSVTIMKHLRAAGYLSEKKTR
ncbi:MULTISPECIES: hypothetical protein [Pseudomonas]|uniref:hypothetical protein n=1 Tax=Pseudomonas TaxID=286 RepID=UPI000C2A6EEA|nr:MULTISPECIES: hypothetical protein [Pseudomonas]PJY96146.1 hypothetical protein COO64_11095 [Pseudomonas donghuensis]UVM66149.1 hypothetical protein LOY34_23025 [Pseudomonas sp. B21-009]WKY27615.1 hypothetical protein QYF67_22525 [Pseudomonas donghuensis]